MALNNNTFVTLVVTFNGNYQQLTLESGLTVSTKRRTLVRSISFQADTANAGVCYIAGVQRDGSAPNDYSVQIPIPASTVPAAPYILGDNLAQYPLCALEDFYVKGTNNEKMRIGICVFNP